MHKNILFSIFTALFINFNVQAADKSNSRLSVPLVYIFGMKEKELDKLNEAFLNHALTPEELKIMQANPSPDSPVEYVPFMGSLHTFTILDPKTGIKHLVPDPNGYYFKCLAQDAKKNPKNRKELCKKMKEFIKKQ